MGLDHTLNLRDYDELEMVLSQFRKRVLPDLDRIVDVFPEYTPHNERHIGNLMGLKELLLGPAVLPKLSGLESFILDAAILSHDWGMAVSADEQSKVLFLQEGMLAEEPRILREFLNDRGWKDEDASKLAEDDCRSDWAEYVRKTHHLRSGQRIREWFGPCNSDLGEAIALIAEGHGFDFREIENERLFPVEKSVHGSNVNMQALAIYLRLIDLLDICKNRTPYEMWRFVKPKDRRSAIEWQKHAALRPPMRRKNPSDWLEIEAEPEDAETLAELRDLREWCLDEFDRGRRLLKRNSLSEYHYDLTRIEFTIRPRKGLHSVPVRFTFDHQRTLELLGEELYGHDPYVFIRELVQNALDASRARRERRRLKGDPLADELVIQVKVDESEDGAQIITVMDDGTGMDLYVIEHYLSVAGASYYRSKDFQRLGLKFDPISRFGIGILSCFAVADGVEIETRTDPVLNSPSEAWKIEIPARMRFWSILKKTDPGKPGTSVKVRIEPERLKKFPPKLRKRPALHVAKYLKTVVSMSDHPIVITEGSKQSVILCPGADAQIIAAWEERGVTTMMDSPSLPLEDLLEAPDVDHATEALEVVTFDLSDLGVPAVSGFLSYVTPKQDWHIEVLSGFRMILTHSSGRHVTLNGNQNLHQTPFLNMDSFSPKGDFPSDKCDPFVRCYCNGVLVPGGAGGRFLAHTGSKYSSMFGLPWLRVNLTGEWAQTISMDRGSLGFLQKSSWDASIFEAWNRYQAEVLTQPLLEMSPAMRFLTLVRLWNFHWVNLETFAKCFPIDEWPVTVLDEEGCLDVLRWGEVRLWSEIPVAPRLLVELTSGEFFGWLLDGGKLSHPRVPCNWEGQKCVIDITWDQSMGFRCPKVSTIPLKAGPFVEASRYLEAPPVFLEDVGTTFYPPLKQSVYRSRKPDGEEKIDGYPDEYLLRVAKDPLQVPAWQLKRRPAFMGFQTQFVRPDDDLVPTSFGRYFCWNEADINVCHPLGDLMCKIVFACEYRAWTQSRDDVAAVKIRRAVRELHGLLSPVGHHTRRKAAISLREINHAFTNIINVAVEDLKVIERPAGTVLLLPEDFLPGAFTCISTESDVSVAALTLENDLIPGWMLQRCMNHPDAPSFGRTLGRDSPWPPRDIMDRKPVQLRVG